MIHNDNKTAKSPEPVLSDKALDGMLNAASERLSSRRRGIDSESVLMARLKAVPHQHAQQLEATTPADSMQSAPQLPFSRFSAWFGALIKGHPALAAQAASLVLLVAGYSVGTLSLVEDGYTETDFASLDDTSLTIDALLDIDPTGYSDTDATNGEDA